MIEQHDSTPHNYPLDRTIPLGEPTRQMRVLRRRDTSELSLLHIYTRAGYRSDTEQQPRQASWLST